MIFKEYKFNNDFINCLQDRCGEHYWICDTFTEEEQKESQKDWNWLENLKKTNIIKIHYVEELPNNANLEENIYCLYNSKKKQLTYHDLFNRVLNYFNEVSTDSFDKKMLKEQLEFYGWSSRKSLLEANKYMDLLYCNTRITKTTYYLNDLELWIDTGQFEQQSLVTEFCSN